MVELNDITIKSLMKNNYFQSWADGTIANAWHSKLNLHIKLLKDNQTIKVDIFDGKKAIGNCRTIKQFNNLDKAKQFIKDNVLNTKQYNNNFL